LDIHTTMVGIAGIHLDTIDGVGIMDSEIVGLGDTILIDGTMGSPVHHIFINQTEIEMLLW